MSLRFSVLNLQKLLTGQFTFRIISNGSSINKLKNLIDQCQLTLIWIDRLVDNGISDLFLQAFSHFPSNSTWESLNPPIQSRVLELTSFRLQIKASIEHVMCRNMAASGPSLSVQSKTRGWIWDELTYWGSRGRQTSLSDWYTEHKTVSRWDSIFIFIFIFILTIVTILILISAVFLCHVPDSFPLDDPLIIKLSLLCEQRQASSLQTNTPPCFPSCLPRTLSATFRIKLSFVCHNQPLLWLIRVIQSGSSLSPETGTNNSRVHVWRKKLWISSVGSANMWKYDTYETLTGWLKLLIPPEHLKPPTKDGLYYSCNH